MAQGKTTDQTSLYRDRRSFAKIPDVMDVPNLIAIQTDSFEFFKGEGLAQAFQDISPIENNTKDMCVEFGRHEFGEPKYTVDECKEKDVSYQAPLFVEIRFINRETGEIKEQDVFMGDFPLMTFTVNFAGAVLIGAVFEAATEGSSLPDNAVLFLKTGVCGGFTTFSAFSLETLALLERGKYATGALYACGSVLACLAGVVIGRLAVRGVRAALTGSAAA